MCSRLCSPNIHKYIFIYECNLQVDGWIWVWKNDEKCEMTDSATIFRGKKMLWCAFPFRSCICKKHKMLSFAISLIMIKNTRLPLGLNEYKTKQKEKEKENWLHLMFRICNLNPPIKVEWVCHIFWIGLLIVTAHKIPHSCVHRLFARAPDTRTKIHARKNVLPPSTLLPRNEESKSAALKL